MSSHSKRRGGSRRGTTASLRRTEASWRRRRTRERCEFLEIRQVLHELSAHGASDHEFVNVRVGWCRDFRLFPRHRGWVCQARHRR